MTQLENTGPAGVWPTRGATPRALIYSRPVVLAVLHSLQPLEKTPASNLQWGGVGASWGCRRPWARRGVAVALQDGGTSWPDRSGAPARASPRLGQRAGADRAAGRAAGARMWAAGTGRGGRPAGRGRHQPARGGFGPPHLLRACRGAPPPLAAQARALSALHPGPGRSLAAVHRCQAAQAGAVHLAGGERAPGEGGRRGADVRAQLARVHRALLRADELGAALQVRHRPTSSRGKLPGHEVLGPALRRAGALGDPLVQDLLDLVLLPLPRPSGLLALTGVAARSPLRGAFPLAQEAGCAMRSKTR